VNQHLSNFVQYLCLCYQEARNVRHLVKAGYLSPQPFERLLLLPTNKIEAWQELARLRAEAAELGTARAASNLFTARFECSAEELIELYRNPHWRSSAYGGNRGRKSHGPCVTSNERLTRTTLMRFRDSFGRYPRCGTTPGRSARSWMA